MSETKTEAARSAEGDETKPAVRRSRFLAARIYTLAIVLRRATNLATKRDFGLSQDKGRIIILVGEYQPLLLTELAMRSALDPGHLSRGVSELVKQGLVRRKRKGRVAELTLTSEGEAIYAQLLEAAMRRNEELLQDFSKAEAERFFRNLETVNLRAEAMYKRERDG